MSSGTGRSGAGARSAGSVLFREETAGPGWLRIVGVVALVAAVLLVVDATVIDPATFQGGGAVAAVIGAIVLVAVGVVVLLAKVIVTVDEREVDLALSPVFHVRFARSDVDSAKTTPLVVRDFGGIGYRVLPGNKRGLLLSAGDGVRVIRRSTGISYSVRSDRPTDLVTALLRRL